MDILVLFGCGSALGFCFWLLGNSRCQHRFMMGMMICAECGMSLRQTILLGQKIRAVNYWGQNPMQPIYPYLLYYLVRKPTGMEWMEEKLTDDAPEWVQVRYAELIAKRKGVWSREFWKSLTQEHRVELTDFRFHQERK